MGLSLWLLWTVAIPIEACIADTTEIWTLKKFKATVGLTNYQKCSNDSQGSRNVSYLCQSHLVIHASLYTRRRLGHSEGVCPFSDRVVPSVRFPLRTHSGRCLRQSMMADIS